MGTAHTLLQISNYLKFGTSFQDSIKNIDIWYLEVETPRSVVPLAPNTQAQAWLRVQSVLLATYWEVRGVLFVRTRVGGICPTDRQSGCSNWR
jgi:hypothetical protein